MPQIQDMAPHPVTVYIHRPVVLSIDVERHTGTHNYPFKCRGFDRPSTRTLANAHPYAGMVVVNQKPFLKAVTHCIMFRDPGLF